jgi:hypothetical protein
MDDSLWALIILGMLIHRAMDFYCAYCKWAQVSRQYEESEKGRPPAYLATVLDQFPKIAMGCGTVTILTTILVIPHVAGSQPSLAVTLPALLFSLAVSTLGFWADYERERFAEL